MILFNVSHDGCVFPQNMSLPPILYTVVVEKKVGNISLICRSYADWCIMNISNYYEIKLSIETLT